MQIIQNVIQCCNKFGGCFARGKPVERSWVLHLLMDNIAAAAQDFEAAIKTDPRLAEAKYNLALTKAKMSAAADAMALLQKM